MPQRFRTFVISLLSLTLMLGSAWASAEIEPDVLEEIAAADCQDLADAYKELAAAEKAIQQSLQESRTETVVTNVVGVATLATLGIGLFSWDDTSEAESALAEVREYLQAVRASATRNKCAFNPQP